MGSLREGGGRDTNMADVKYQKHLSSSYCKNAISPELRLVEINTSPSARTVQLAKTKAITHLLTYMTAFLGRHSNGKQRKKVWKFKRALWQNEETKPI